MFKLHAFFALRISFVVFLAASLFTSPVFAQASHPWQKWADELGIDLNVSYDGTRVMTMTNGQFEASEHKAPQKMYSEFAMGGISGAFIIREDLDKAYTLMPTMGMYRELSLSEGLYEAGGGMEFSEIEAVGKEEVIGHPSTKYKTRFTDKQGKGAGFVWITDTGVPIKMDMIYSSDEVQGMRISSELVELNLRPQDPAIFELPEGLRPMGASGLLGSIFGGQGVNIPGLSNNSPAPAAAPAGSGAAAAPRDSMSSQLTTDNLTQSVQLHLQYLGIDPGNTSGEMSLDTQIAISEFQATKGMKVTGEVTPQLLGVLSAEVDSE